MTKRLLLAMTIALATLVSCDGESIASERQYSVDEEHLYSDAVYGESGLEVVYAGKFGINIKDDVMNSDYTITQYILYDPDTLVMYTYTSDVYTNGLTVMLNPDGTPKTFSKDIDYSNSGFKTVYVGTFGAESSEEGGFGSVSQYIVYDPDNLVMYMYLRDKWTSVLSVMVNADGTPKIYSLP